MTSQQFFCVKKYLQTGSYANRNIRMLIHMLKNQLMIAFMLGLAIFTWSGIFNLSMALQTGYPAPSVPEFTITVKDRSYDVPNTVTVTTDIDGRKINSTSPAFYAIDGSIELSIRRQLFTSYYDSEGYPIDLYYHIRIRGTESVDWGTGAYFKAGNSSSAVVTLNYLGSSFAWAFGIYGFSSYPVNDTLSFQVEAFIGHTLTTTEPTNPAFPIDIKKVEYIGQSSGWSDTQTALIQTITSLAIPTPSSTTTPPLPTATSSPVPIESPTSTPNPTELPAKSPSSATSAPTTPPIVPSIQPTPSNAQTSPTWFFVAIGALVAIIVGLLCVVALLLRKNFSLRARASNS